MLRWSGLTWVDQSRVINFGEDRIFLDLHPPLVTYHKAMANSSWLGLYCQVVLKEIVTNADSGGFVAADVVCLVEHRVGWPQMPNLLQRQVGLHLETGLH